MAAFDNSKPSRPRRHLSLAARAYDVVAVSRAAEQWPQSAEQRPRGAREIRTLLRGVARWAALAFAGGFNRAERRRPYGVWAVIQKSATVRNGRR